MSPDDKRYLWRANRRHTLNRFQLYTFFGLLICAALAYCAVEFFRVALDEPLQFTARQMKAIADCQAHNQVAMVDGDRVECRGVRWGTER